VQTKVQTSFLVTNSLKPMLRTSGLYGYGLTAARRRCRLLVGSAPRCRPSCCCCNFACTAPCYFR